MEHTPEQRDIIRRIGEVNKRIDEVAAESAAFEAKEIGGLSDSAQALISAGNALAGAMKRLAETQRRVAEMHRLCRKHGELFREYLETLL